MESLPNELLLNICQRLTLRDCRSLCSTSRRLYGLLPHIVSSLSIEELVIRDPSDSPNLDFVRRYLAADIRRVVIIVETLSEKLVEYVENLFSICDRVESLTIKTSFGFVQNSRIKMIRTVLTRFQEFISKLSVREIHAAPCFKRFTLPYAAEKCTIDSSFMTQLSMSPLSPTQSFDRLTFMTLQIFKVFSQWQSLQLLTSLRELTLCRKSTRRTAFGFDGLLVSPQLPAWLRRVTLNLTLPASSLSFLADLKELEFLCLLKIDMDVCLRVPAAASSPESVIAALPSLCELQVGGNTIGWDSIF